MRRNEDLGVTVWPNLAALGAKCMHAALGTSGDLAAAVQSICLAAATRCTLAG